ncbi:hypothetical protein ACFW34_35190 [Streptomyces sp. NPDC058848]|uniref:hypothetical protein n=1 Tax=Streptomyces sp. NPDC058848 TaxID=3346650 RepID=UPI00369D7DF0
MTLPGITHEYGPWSPIRFIPVPFRADDEPPAFFVHTTRICRGHHDWMCAQAQSQTFGPFVLEGKAPEDMWRCPNCSRVQPPSDPAPAFGPVCLYCTDMATVQHLGDGRATTAAVSAVAALHAATTTLRHAKAADASGYLALLEDTGDELRAVLEDAAQAIRQQPERAAQTGYGHLTLIARQVLANAKTYADMFADKDVKDVKAIDNGNGEQ